MRQELKTLIEDIEHTIEGTEEKELLGMPVFCCLHVIGTEGTSIFSSNGKSPVSNLVGVALTNLFNDHLLSVNDFCQRLVSLHDRLVNEPVDEQIENIRQIANDHAGKKQGNIAEATLERLRDEGLINV